MSRKQLYGDEFKFILNDYPDIMMSSTAPTEIKTVKLRIYKVFEPRMNPHNHEYQMWKEVNLID